jgi:hypothetical protein
LILSLATHVFILVSGLFLPGWLCCRLLRLPANAGWSFVLSLPLLLNTLLACNALGIPLAAGAGCLLVGSAALTALLLLRDRRQQPAPAASGLQGPFRFGDLMPTGLLARLCALAALMAALAVLTKLILLPLSGWDHAFRWDYLGLLMDRFQRLDFYPVHRPSDHGLYPWCDGIPPMVSCLQYLSYLAWPEPQKWMGTPHIVLQMLLLFWLTAKLARQLAGPSAQWPAVALLCTSALSLWVFSIGQETILTAIGLVGLVVALGSEELAPRQRWILAGVCAGLGALAREYGLAWIFAGLFGLWLRGEVRAGARHFLAAALLACSAWYLRNWALTGNPLFPHRLGGLFPGSPVYDEILDFVYDYTAPWVDPRTFLHHLLEALPSYVLPFLAAALALPRLLRERRHTRLVCGTILLTVILWLVSVSKTAGGWGYSMRVLQPASALAAALGGAWLAGLAGRWRTIAGAVLVAACVFAGVHSWQLPINQTPKLSDYLSLRWTRSHLAFAGFFDNDDWKRLIAFAGNATFLADDPTIHAALLKQGGQVTSLFNPDLQFLFDEHRTYEEQRRLLLAQGIRFVINSEGNSLSEARAKLHHFFPDLATHCPRQWRIGFFRIYDLSAESTNPAANPAKP